MDDSNSPRFLGLASASMTGAFLTTNANISLIYDAMTVDWNNGKPDPERMPSTHFAIIVPPEARGRAARFDLRGFVQPVGAGTIELQVGETRLEARPGAEEYLETFTAALSADSETTRVVATLNLPTPNDGSATMLTLDAIDIGFADCATH